MPSEAQNAPKSAIQDQKNLNQSQSPSGQKGAYSNQNAANPTSANPTSGGQKADTNFARTDAARAGTGIEQDKNNAQRGNTAGGMKGEALEGDRSSTSDKDEDFRKSSNA